MMRSIDLYSTSFLIKVKGYPKSSLEKEKKRLQRSDLQSIFLGCRLSQSNNQTIDEDSAAALGVFVPFDFLRGDIPIFLKDLSDQKVFLEHFKNRVFLAQRLGFSFSRR
jgi:hypothetical protein